MSGCKDLRGCREKAERLQKYLAGVLPVAEERWEDLKQQGRVLHKTKHLISRMYERAISDKDIEDVVENGWPIEYFVEKEKETFILMGYTRKKGLCILSSHAKETKSTLIRFMTPVPCLGNGTAGIRSENVFAKMRRKRYDQINRRVDPGRRKEG